MHKREKAIFKRKECKCRELCDKMLYKHTALGIQRSTQNLRATQKCGLRDSEGKRRALGHYKIQRRVVAHTKKAIMHSMGINMAD